MFIVLLVALLFTGIANASLKECDSPLDPFNIPCFIISTYSFNCSSNTITIYNSTPAIVLNVTWDDYSTTSRCNITFNLTERDSYLINSTEGSSATIIVGGVKMEFLNLAIFGIIFVIGLALIAFMHKFKEDTGSSIAYGFFSLALFAILGSITMFGFQIINPALIELPFNINKVIGLICFVIGMYSAWFSVELFRFKRVERDEERRRNEFEVR